MGFARQILFTSGLLDCIGVLFKVIVHNIKGIVKRHELLVQDIKLIT
jgi:hypothetical protein